MNTLRNTMIEFEIASKNEIGTYAYVAGYYHSVIKRLAEMVPADEVAKLQANFEEVIKEIEERAKQHG